MPHGIPRPRLPRHLWIASLATLVGLGGCQPPAAEEKGPSYADLVVTYNAELAALDRLEQKRRTLIEDFQRQQAGGPSEAMKIVADALKASAEGVPDGLDLTDLDQLADFAAQQAASAQDVTRQLRDSLAPEEQAAAEPAQAEQPKSPEQVAFESELARLDAEIAAQRERVERARQARDAAET